MTEIISLGSLYLNGIPVPHKPCPEYKKDQKIKLGDGQPGAPLPWLVVGKKLVATESLLYNISWSQLNKAGLINGTKVKMSGLEFMCHVPHIYKSPSEPDSGMRSAQLWDERPKEDETDLLIARAVAGAESRPTKDGMFWTKVIGNDTMRGRDLGWIDNQVHIAKFCGYYRPNGYFSWIPVLEPINMPEPAENINKDMIFVLPGFVLKGKPVEVSDYDLLVRANPKEIQETMFMREYGCGKWWNVLDKDIVVLERDKLIHCAVI